MELFLPTSRVSPFLRYLRNVISHQLLSQGSPAAEFWVQLEELVSRGRQGGMMSAAAAPSPQGCQPGNWPNNPSLAPPPLPHRAGASSPPESIPSGSRECSGARSTWRGCACGRGSLPARVLISFWAALAAASRRAQLRSGRGTSAVETWEELTIPKDWLHTRPSKSCWLPA